MTLEEILTNRTRLSDDILKDVKEAAGTYGIAILRADVKDLIFPGNLQEIMNRVLATERLSEAQLVEARTHAEVARIEARAAIESSRERAEAQAQETRRTAEVESEVDRIRAESQVAALESKRESAEAYARHPALLRLEELDALKELAKSANARIYIGFDKHMEPGADDPEPRSRSK
jgi:regulator of protease activity HflC (stomatin/prohibitin superfamily)